MKPFFTTRRKSLELVVLVIMDLIFYFLWNSLDFVTLFTLGFVWNWVASQDMVALTQNKRYRFSTLKIVMNLQSLILRPLDKAPEAIKLIARSLPAGIFWSAVILFNESQMPWWAVFIGSFTLELVQIEPKLFKMNKEPQP